MSRPRTPTQVLAIRGAFRKHPERKREREGEPEPTVGLGEPPTCLDEAERARWKEIAKACAWLTEPDRFVVEMTCRLIMRDRRGHAKAADRAQLAANLGRLGMNPSDRSKVKMPTRADAGTVKKRRFFGGKTA